MKGTPHFLLLTGLELGTLLSVSLGLAGILSPLGANADGGIVRTKQAQGPFIVTIFTPPEPSRDQPAEVALMIQRRETGEVVMNAEVELSFVPPAGAKLSPIDALCTPNNVAPLPELIAVPGQPFSLRARRSRAANQLCYGASIVLRTAGDWAMRATIRQGDDTASVSCSLPVGISPHPLTGLWPYLALPPAVIVLFAMNRLLRRRTLEASRVESGRKNQKTRRP